ncbi:peptidyl-prolyl cis-trans isomerase CYP59-like isoform X1 [Quercus robur]|uniref:peptidyl-prolyl cis-trans isomerase CYP59-like isoform X1 n=1 Tax=Quercus robur TaxID=38942 RepID=UPI002162965D|nr:peptidyl-prolyl cis-trans isomerase CYP59-like isoform X1 [Quercus robur]
MSVLIVTSLGDIVVDLHTDKCPLTSKNFLKLCKIKYYNGCLFHTVQKDFTAQTGDPTGTGSGGDSIYKFLYGDQARFFNDEIHHDLKHSKTGTVAMASAGENLNASQFYFTLRDDLDYLDEKHTVFGEIAEGLDTLTRINEAYVDEKGRPFKNIRIKHTYILDDPFDDPPQIADLIPDASPEGKPKDEVDDNVRLEDDWVPMDEQLDASELEEVLRTKEAHSRAVVLESIGDIPDAEIKPPDNVLFVCKLNPVTEDEDLHTIFSRFGTVLSAEIIRDFKTGDSLCYAFVEFETNDACEQAYFKMDNALIDDRRIHVDFSQSVSKLWSQYRRKDNKTGKGGCFKCGALDHVAKDCTGGSAVKQNYILKDDNRQRGGENNSRFEMVFDGDTPESPRREKRHRGHEPRDRGEKEKTYRQSSEDLRHRDRENEDQSDRHKPTDRSRRYREDEMHHDGKTSQSRGSGRDRDHVEERRDGEKHKQRDLNDNKRDERDYVEERRDGEKYKRRGLNDNNRDERDYRKRTPDIDRHAEKGDDGDYKKRSKDNSSHAGRRDDREYRKRGADNDNYIERSNGGDYRKKSADDDRRGERRDDRDYRKRNVDSDRRDTRDEPSQRKRSADVDSFKGRREEREHGDRYKDRRDDDHDRRRQGDRR